MPSSIGSQMHRALVRAGCDFRFHLKESRLGFPFGGAHLATLLHPGDRHVLYWWTEAFLRYPDSERDPLSSPGFTVAL